MNPIGLVGQPLACSRSPVLTHRLGATQAPIHSPALEKQALGWLLRDTIDRWLVHLPRCPLPAFHNYAFSPHLPLFLHPSVCYSLPPCNPSTTGVGSGSKSLQYRKLQSLILVRKGSRVRYKKGRSETLTWELLSIKTPWAQVSKVKLQSIPPQDPLLNRVSAHLWQRFLVGLHRQK